MPFQLRSTRFSTALSTLLALEAFGLGACTERHHLDVTELDAGAGASAGSTISSRGGAAEAMTDEPVRVSIARGEAVEALILLDPAQRGGSVDQVEGDGGLGSTSGNAVIGDAAVPAADPTAAIRAAQDALLAAVSASGVEPIHAYENFPMLHANVLTEAGLAALVEQPAVVHVYANKTVFPTLTQSLPLIGQPTVGVAGQTGSGTAVAVLDTGTDYTRAAFGSCSMPGTPSCKVAYAQDFAPDDNNLDANGHGTNVAGIVLGVAPSTKILALDVFTGPSGYSNVILQAVDWVIQTRATYNTVAMNLSLGSGLYTAACPNDVFASGMAAARAAGVLPVIATGNDGISTSISSPACVPSAVAVAAVYDSNVGGVSFPGAHCTDATTQADQVTCFSNSSSTMAIFAPGSSISAAGLAMSGTSQATPHVAGATAVVSAAHPTESIDQIATRIINNGPMLTDARNNVQKHRLDLVAAVGTGSSPAPTPPPPPDTTGPAGSVVIQGGRERTNLLNVTLTLSATDASGVASMCISATTKCTAFTTYETSRVFALAKGDGQKSVYVFFKDTVGNVSSVATDSIVLDTTKPKDGKATVAPGNGSVSVSVAGASDTGSAVSYKVVYATSKAAPADCATGTAAATSTSSSFAIPSLDNGTTYFFRLCAVDAAGNSSAGVTFTTRPAPEFAGPVGTLTIANGSAYTNAATVNLTISATDASGIAAMCLSNTTTCAAWVPYTSTPTFKLNKTAGSASVYVFLRDIWGNQTSTPLSDTVVVDIKAPTLSTFTGQLSSGSASLTWGAASDGTDGSGIASYTVVYAAGTRPPASCTTGTVVYQGLGTAASQSGLATGKHSYRLCVSDVVGNLNTGKTLTLTAL